MDSIEEYKELMGGLPEWMWEDVEVAAVDSVD